MSARDLSYRVTYRVADQAIHQPRRERMPPTSRFCTNCRKQKGKWFHLATEDMLQARLEDVENHGYE